MEITEKDTSAIGYLTVESVQSVVHTLKEELQKIMHSKSAGNIRSLSHILTGMVEEASMPREIEAFFSDPEICRRLGKDALDNEDKKILLLTAFSQQDLEMEKIFQLKQHSIPAEERERLVHSLYEMGKLFQTPEKNIHTYRQTCLYMLRKIKPKLHILQIIKDIYVSMAQQLDSLCILLERTEVESMLFAETLHTVDSIRQELKSDFNTKPLGIDYIEKSLLAQERTWKDPSYASRAAQTFGEHPALFIEKLLHGPSRTQISEMLFAEELLAKFLTNWQKNHLNVSTAQAYMVKVQEQFSQTVAEEEQDSRSKVPLIRAFSFSLSMLTCFLLSSAISLLVYWAFGEKYSISLFVSIVKNTKCSWYVFIGLMSLVVGLVSSGLFRLASVLVRKEALALHGDKMLCMALKGSLVYAISVNITTLVIVAISYMCKAETSNVSQGICVLVYFITTVVLTAQSCFLFSNDKSLFQRSFKRLCTGLGLFSLFFLYIGILYITTIAWITQEEIKKAFTNLIYKYVLIKTFKGKR
ncbi:hypothetical protein NECID01_1726 [Nematocida sp. AWRm77]|nr:hypothetical protein NECID01_1726 [Nematocida sp. AWRm77]